MGITSRYEYLNGIRERYHSATKAQKKIILDEFCAVCGYNRKYAIRLLNAKSKHRRAVVKSYAFLFEPPNARSRLGQEKTRLRVNAIQIR